MEMHENSPMLIPVMILYMSSRFGYKNLEPHVRLRQQPGDRAKWMAIEDNEVVCKY